MSAQLTRRRSNPFALQRYELEWLRCLTISTRLVPVLPDDVLAKLVDQGCVEMNHCEPRITPRGRETLAGFSQTPPATQAAPFQLQPTQLKHNNNRHST